MRKGVTFAKYIQGTKEIENETINWLMTFEIDQLLSL
jgi:hypothetical protein